MTLAGRDDPCSLCGKPLGDEPVIGFTFVASEHPLVRLVDDWAVHRHCLEGFPQRDELVEAWNKEAADGLGPMWMLKVTDDGRVRRLSWWDRFLYCWRSAAGRAKLWQQMKRVILTIATTALCVSAGASAGPVAFASELHWPLSEINFRDSVRLGIGWGVAGAFIAAIVLSCVEFKYLWVTSGTAVAATWMITFAVVWWLVVSSLG